VTIDLVTAWLTHLNATAGLFCSIREAVEDHEAAFLAWLQAQRAQTPQDDIATMFQLATDLQTARALLAQLVARCGLSMVLEEVVLPVLQNAVAQPLDDDETA
jgi:hypothetical protein